MKEDDTHGLTDSIFAVATSSTVARRHVMTSSFQKLNLEPTWAQLPSHITYPFGQIRTLPKYHLLIFTAWKSYLAIDNSS